MGILRGWKFDGLRRLGKIRAQDGAVWDVQVLMRLLAMFRGKKKLSLCHKFRKFDAPLSPLRSMFPAPYHSKTRHI